MNKIITWVKKTINNIWAWEKMVIKKIWNLMKIIAEWIWIFIKKVWLGTVGVALWLSASFIIYKQTDLLISDKIQAWAIVTLVFVTLYYARQTQNLVAQEKESLDEEKKVRNANFGEKRVKDFYYPTYKELNELKKQLEKTVIDYELFSKTIRNYVDIFLDNFHMSPTDDKEKIFELNRMFLSIRKDVKKGKLEKETKDKILIKIDEIHNLLQMRIFEVEILIQKTYEFYAG